MVVLDGNFALGCGPGTDYPQIHIFQCMLERNRRYNEWGSKTNYVRSSIFQCTSSPSPPNTAAQCTASHR